MIPNAVLQFYCEKDKRPCKAQQSNPAIFNVTFSGIVGTSFDVGMQGGGVSLNCSDSMPCANLRFHSIDIIPTRQKHIFVPLIRNAFGMASDITYPSMTGLPEGPIEKDLQDSVTNQAAYCG